MKHGKAVLDLNMSVVSIEEAGSRVDQNIYLDIDGVLLTKDLKPANYVQEFLQYVLTNNPNSTYWLTTRCQENASRTIQDIGHLFDDKTVELMKKIKPTTWLGSTKTDAIDFNVPFLWFDDNLFLKEREVLLSHGVLDNWIEVNLRKNPNMLLLFLNDFPIPM